MSKKTEKIDYSNTKQLVDDIWLFLTDKPRHKSATIKREAFDHEVAAMIEAVREYERTKYLATLAVMSPEQFQKFLDLKFKDLAKVANELEQRLPDAGKTQE